MKLDKQLLRHVHQQSDVLPGNIYPAKGGKRTPGTDFWLVVAVSENGAHCIGYSADGDPVSTASYLKGALRDRPLVGRVDISSAVLRAGNESTFV